MIVFIFTNNKLINCLAIKLRLELGLSINESKSGRVEKFKIYFLYVIRVIVENISF